MMEIPISRLTPRELRGRFRKGLYAFQQTSGLCEGFTQMNVVIVHQDYATYFAKFCNDNSGCLPLLYQSKVGELSAGRFCPDSDIRRDLSGYSITRRGQVELVSEVTEDLSDFVTFYLGCSFSFERILIKNGVRMRNVDEGKDVSMYRTNVALIPSGPFQGRMVVSMRPIPFDKLSLCCSLTEPLNTVHGCPVHIGDPAKLGILDLSCIDYGDPITLNEGEVPVFWGCGASAMDSVAELPLAITQCARPSTMFITDEPMEDLENVQIDNVAVHCVDYKSQSYGICGKETYRKLVDFEAESRLDPVEFASSCFALSQAKTVLLSTDFNPTAAMTPPCLADGILGTFTLARVLLASGTYVTILVDSIHMGLFRRIVQETDNWNGIDNLSMVEADSLGLTEPYDVYVSIGKTSCASDETNDAVNADRHPKENGENYSGISRNTCCSFNVNAGAGSRGAWGLAFGVLALNMCPIHDRYKRRGIGYAAPPPSFIPTSDTERSLFNSINRALVGEGFGGLDVAELRIDPDHADYIRELLSTFIN